MRILHISDIHIGPSEASNSRGINARESLRRMLTDLETVPDVDVVVVSGDVADDGSVEAYTAARRMVRGFALRKRAAVVFCTGNHDERGAFAKVLGSGHLGADGSDLAATVVDSPEGERGAASVIGGRRFITLDSLVPGKVYGRIGARQLDWLRAVLAVPAPHGSVVVLHHPPVALGVEVQKALGLQNGSDLADAVRGTDVRLVLSGHFHLQLFGHLASVPVWVTPGVLSRVDLTGPPGTERAVRGASATLVDLDGPHAPLFHVLHARDPRAGETVYELDREQLRSVIDRLGPGA
ncbi:metallophosphoesterase [Streptomyces sp. NBC_01717]|uniref:metallophosphoesterase family protein n=1 Tax=Streptomyces sp. NBC_01717 TaxID=2975918 RepID=UPI002E315A39|nr:metallophosphoesterase [Streptomyces sp. NBC_01717]